LDDLVYQVVQVSNERGEFFDDDLIKETHAAGYFGTGMIAAAALKIGKGGIGKIVDAVNKLKKKPKTDAEGNKIKLKDRLKGIFKKDKDGQDVSPDTLADNETAKEIAKEAGAEDVEDDEEKDDDKKKKKGDKKILGMSYGMFAGLLFLLIIIVVVLIVVIRKNRKKAVAEKK
jgi:hypothetical protein